MSGAYVYIVACSDGTWYTGWTTDLLRRLKAHNSGKGARYTRSRLPVRLIYAEALSDRNAALRREYEIKQLSKAQKEKLVKMQMPRIFYLMGKSASGKDALYRRLLADPELNLSPMVIYTTRPVRSGEQEGVEYHFTDEKHLRQLQAAGRVVELRRYETVHGIWSYFTVDDFSGGGNYLGIGTLESFRQIREYYGEEHVIPLYVEVEDGLRLERALRRERQQEVPRYEEMCRRFLADQKDFEEEKLQEAGIGKRFSNDADLESCLALLKNYIFKKGTAAGN